MDFLTLAQQCAPEVHHVTLHALVRTESGFNPWAIGVVGPPLKRQPRSRAEALQVVDTLERKGMNYSLGYAQINQANFSRLGLTRHSAFDPCANLNAASRILVECYARARRVESEEQLRLRAAFSCYYSGNFRRGFQADGAKGSSYVDRVVEHALGQRDRPGARVATGASEWRQGDAVAPSSGWAAR